MAVLVLRVQLLVAGGDVGPLVRVAWQLQSVATSPQRLLLLIILDTEALRLGHLRDSEAFRGGSMRLPGCYEALCLGLEDEEGDLDHSRGVGEQLLSPLFRLLDRLDVVAAFLGVLEHFLREEVCDVLVEELEGTADHLLSLVRSEGA